MKSAWNNEECVSFSHDPLEMRTYTSRLLGRESGLVLHGGGNTSVKIDEADYFGESRRLLYVKGSGWDLATIKPAGFAPVCLKTLTKLANMETLSDIDMVRIQRSALANPDAPNPSVEAILHAIIPYKFVDHSHSDAVVAISNTPGGPDRLRAHFGNRILFIPYVMPGFKLAKAVWNRIQNLDWSEIEGIILLHHGVFTFSDSARVAYENMIQIVTEAETILESEQAYANVNVGRPYSLNQMESVQFASLRKAASEKAGQPLLARFTGTPSSNGFACLNNVRLLSQRGPVTPDHVIHTKRVAAIFDGDPKKTVSTFAQEYEAYFRDHSNEQQARLDSAPRWAVWPDKGTISFGVDPKRVHVVHDIIEHTIHAIQWGEALGGWTALPAKDIFEIEYWELEQAKLRKNTHTSDYRGRVALVTGAASGIGAACVQALHSAGAAVAALDISPCSVSGKGILSIQCDVTKPEMVKAALQKVVSHFGGIDILISNAGNFPPNQTIEDISPDDWSATLTLNLTSHQQLLSAAAPYLFEGIRPAVVLMGSKNVPAPGPGVAAYSTAKAGLTQLGRVAALEWGHKGVRVNTLHPNGVFDTGIWDPERVQSRAQSYGITVEEYRSKNVLGADITSEKVAAMALAMVGPTFECTTGAQIPIDGGNERVI